MHIVPVTGNGEHRASMSDAGNLPLISCSLEAWQTETWKQLLKYDSAWCWSHVSMCQHVSTWCRDLLDIVESSEICWTNLAVHGLLRIKIRKKKTWTLEMMLLCIAVPILAQLFKRWVLLKMVLAKRCFERAFIFFFSWHGLYIKVFTRVPEGSWYV